MRQLLVDGQGNFGSIDGDMPAAMRYTEVRMEKITGSLLDDLENDTVDFRENYDGSRTEPSVPARSVLNQRQLTILRARAKVKLSRSVTVREALLAIAAEGGHIKNNGDPGWQVLGRGYEKLLHMEAGFVLGQAAK